MRNLRPYSITRRLHQGTVLFTLCTCLRLLESTTFAQPILTNLGVLPGYESSSCSAVSDDGSTVVGWCETASGIKSAFRWDPEAGMQTLPTSRSECTNSLALAVDATGTNMSGYNSCNWELSPAQFGLSWNQPGAATELSIPNILTFWTRVKAMSNDGSMLAGDYQLFFNQPKSFYYVAGTWHYAMPLPGDVESHANCVSGDGQWVVGYSISASQVWTAVRWHSGNLELQPESLGTMQGATLLEPLATNDDGTVIVGSAPTIESPTTIPFIWTPSQGARPLCPLPTGFSGAKARAVSGDGTIIGGEGILIGHKCFLYRQDLGLVDLATYLASKGVDVTGWQFKQITGFSSDGTTVVGNGYFNSEDILNAWIVTGLPGPIVCNDIDFNNDGSLFDPQDIEAYLSVYSEGPCIPASSICDSIDFNNDGSVFDPCDIDAFLLVYSEGPCTTCGD